VLGAEAGATSTSSASGRRRVPCARSLRSRGRASRGRRHPARRSTAYGTAARHAAASPVRFCALIASAAGLSRPHPRNGPRDEAPKPGVTRRARSRGPGRSRGRGGRTVRGSVWRGWAGRPVSHRRQLPTDTLRREGAGQTLAPSQRRRRDRRKAVPRHGNAPLAPADILSQFRAEALEERDHASRHRDGDDPLRDRCSAVTLPAQSLCPPRSASFPTCSFGPPSRRLSAGTLRSEHAAEQTSDQRRRRNAYDSPRISRMDPPTPRRLSDTDPRRPRRPMLGPDFDNPIQKRLPRDLRL
jgi:hypothetical protein